MLADALALADEEKPDLLIDLGTLTGAARVALGPDLPPFYTNDETLAADVARMREARRTIRCGACRCGRLTIRWLDSKTANINNAPSGGFAGSITCALFLQRFVDRGQELAACRYLRLDAVGKARAPRRRRMPGRARDLQTAERTLCMIRA